MVLGTFYKKNFKTWSRDNHSYTGIVISGKETIISSLPVLYVFKCRHNMIPSIALLPNRNESVIYGLRNTDRISLPRCRTKWGKLRFNYEALASFNSLSRENRNIHPYIYYFLEYIDEITIFQLTEYRTIRTLFIIFYMDDYWTS
jgi:hypothetical protein